MTLDTAMTLRLPNKLHTQLRAAAKHERRSLNAHILFLLEEYIERRIVDELEIDWPTNDDDPAK